MLSFHFFMVAAVVSGGLVGYGIASNDLLQQVFLERKFSHRLTEFLCTALVLIILWVRSPSILTGVIPVAACILYMLLCLALHLVLKRRAPQCGEPLRNELRETALRTGISVLMAVGTALLLCLAMGSSPRQIAQIHVSAAEQSLCHGMLLGVITLLLMALGHYLLALRLYSSDNAAPSRSLLKLRKELRGFPPI